MLLITTVVVLRGVKGGIEKVCNILLPLMFLFIIFLAIRAIMLPGAGEGVKFYLLPDFSSLNGEAVMAAIGQSFFALGRWMRKSGCLRLLSRPQKDNRQQHAHGCPRRHRCGDFVWADYFPCCRSLQY